MEEKNSQNNGLKPVFTPLGMWAFSIGTSIGWGSFIVTCNTYLQKSGILGTIFGLVAGMAVIIVITWNLQHMIRYSPDAGGIYTFEKKAAGKDVGFVTFWFVLLTYLAILWANITSVPLFCRFFLGDTFRFGFHYTVFGYEVWFGETLLSICAIVLIGLLCIRSSRIPNRIMVVSAIVFAAGFTVCAVIALFLHDNSFSYSPLYTSGSTDFAQIVRIAAISPWAFIGFENISHFSGEYAFPLKRVRRILIWSVVLTTALYIFVSLLSISAYPPEYGSWLEYIGDMGNLEGIKAVPAFYAAQYYLGQTGVVVLMLSLFAVILTSLIGNLLALSRLLYAAGRDGEAPGALSELNKHGIPAKAILAVVAVSVVIPFLGRTAIGWIVDVTTLGATMIYGLLSYAVFRHAGSEGRKPERYTGMLGMLLMGFFLILLLVPGILPFNAMETASYALFIVWSLIGLVYFRVLTMRRKHSDYGQRIVVWIVLLVLVLFAAMMWVSRVTERTAQDAVEQIYEYHESHEGTENAVTAEQRKSFLESQADRIGNTNILYTIVSLGLFMLSTGIILHNYRDTRKISEQLAVTEEAKRSAEKIASLRESISSLLDNMPGLNFAKDADTGVYLACNQAFAEYANKEDPHGVVGLADSDIFDAETAEHFREDDRMALSMDKPYIFFEDVADAGGKNRRQLQTTKLKYTDDQGRLCILGMCQDVTELVRVQRENATTKEAYEQARKNTIIFTHIAQTLAGGYTELYYVNVDTGEFTEYIPGANGKMLIEERHDFHFFEKSKADAEKYVHPDDREKVIDALNKRSLLDAIAETGTFTLTYRVLTEGGRITNELLQKYDAELTTGEDSITTYVTMRGSRMEDDENCIVLAVLDVDEEVKARRAAERMKEESIAYGRINALSGDFLCVYVVVPETGRYREYSASSGYEMFSIPKEGDDFFASSRKQISGLIYEPDLPRFYKMFTKEGVMSEIERNGFFTFSYRLMMDGKPNYVRLKAVMVDESDGQRLIVGVSDIDRYVREEEEYARRLAQAQSEADRDALTGIRNRHAFLNAEEQLDNRIADNNQPDFAVIILDVNNLKAVNDTQGHKAGDRLIKDACRIICGFFKHSPVFRVGGDEFAILAQGQDYEHIDELVEKMNEHNREAMRTGGIVIACGMAKFENDTGVAPVYERADQKMYENKKWLKSGRVNS